jgi:CBS domain-containing protein
MYEIMSFIAFASWDPNNNDVNLQEFVSKTEMEQPARNLLGTSGVEASDNINSLWIQPSTANVKDTIELMGKGVYRLLVDCGNNKFKILSQSDLARFFLQHWEKFKFKDAIVSEAFKQKTVHKISTAHSALKGFQSIRLYQVNVFVVVDEHGKLVGTLSGSDLRGLSHDKVTNVMLPVMEFLKGQRQGGQQPVTCKNTDTVQSVIQKLVSEKVHRIWMIDDAHHPIGVISLSDIALYVFTQTLEVWYPAEGDEAN